LQAQREAKLFFVERVLAQARADGISLTEAEQRMLSWSESDPDFEADPALVRQLAADISDEVYEDKVAGLLRRVFRQDVMSNPAARDRYRLAYDILRQGDHYILIMIDRALGRQLRPWWAFWR
jgi:hypothetical protein